MQAEKQITAEAQATAGTRETLISIVIPTYNTGRWLAQAIESCLDQTHRNLELVVVDDACPERSGTIAEEYARKDPRVRVIWNPRNLGVAQSFNAGYRVARGEYFTRLAGDDYFAPEALDLMAAHLAGNPDVGVVYCDMLKVDENGKILRTMEVEPDPERALYPDCRVGLCLMWRREAHDEVGGFDSRGGAAEDYDYWLRVKRKFKFSKVPDCAPFHYRFHAGQGSNLLSPSQDFGAMYAKMRNFWADVREHPFRPAGWRKFAAAAVWTSRYWYRLKLHTARKARATSR
jgi:glycosyltransferase involved in cell wall biosynthesis